MLTPSPEEQQRLDENRKRRDLQSQQMSELLLKGWKMLGDHCPVTGEVPLMQQPKTRRKFSVAIGKFIDELQPEQPTQPATVPPPVAQVPAATPTSPARAPEAARPSVTARSAPFPPQSLRALSAHPSQHAESAGASSVAPALDAAAAEVLCKLQGYTAQLRGAHHPAEAQQLIALIGECARTLSALNTANASAN